jgi:hypothetical protein
LLDERHDFGGEEFDLFGRCLHGPEDERVETVRVSPHKEVVS